MVVLRKIVCLCSGTTKQEDMPLVSVKKHIWLQMKRYQNVQEILFGDTDYSMVIDQVDDACPVPADD